MKQIIELWRALAEVEDGVVYIVVGLLAYALLVGLDIFLRVDPFNWIP